MFNKNKLIEFVLTSVLYLAVFIFSINLPTDPDLGWHLKYGEYFFNTGNILRENIFSTMMPNYLWTNHSWASDLLIFLFYKNSGFIGISILGALVVIFTFFILSKAFRLDIWSKAFIFPILLLLVNNVNVVSFRSQMLSYLFTAILIFILTKYQENKKYLFYCIPLFLIWANFHGGFIVGLIILLGFIGIKKIMELRESFNLKNVIFSSKLEVIIIIGALLSTLINPFGYGVYLESLNHFGNPWLKYVSEWSAFEDLSSQWWKLVLFINLYLAGLLLLFMNGRLRKNLTFGVLVLIFFVLSLFERRYAWSMYYMSVSILLGISEYFRPSSKSAVRTIVLVLSSGFLFLTLQFKKTPTYYLTMNWKRFCQNSANACSYQAINFISKNNLTKDLSTPYSWGGWMIWNYPKIKPSIDGRMHLWKDKNGYSAFGEYYTFVQDWKSIDKSKYENVVVLKQKPMFKRLKKLSLQGKWRFVYEDEISAVFVRKNHL